MRILGTKPVTTKEEKKLYNFCIDRNGETFPGGLLLARPYFALSDTHEFFSIRRFLLNIEFEFTLLSELI